ncbi:MAG: hypothetical protein Tsb009_20930 [Planctomycetaceae bacterium]
MVKEQTRLFNALRVAVQAGTPDPALIALNVLTSKKKVEQWGSRLIHEGVIAGKHLQLFDLE